jgi:hypothetical protein
MALEKIGNRKTTTTTLRDGIKVVVKDLDPVIDAFNAVVPIEGTAKANTISEYDAGSGVTVDGVLLKDGTVQTVNGAIDAPAIRGAATNSGIYFDSGQVYLETAGSHYAGLNGSGNFIVNTGATTGGIKTSVANTQVLIYYTSIKETIAAGTGGAISKACYYTDIAADVGGDAFTLASGNAVGQLKKIMLSATAGGTAVVTGAFRGANRLTFTNAGEF